MKRVLFVAVVSSLISTLAAASAPQAGLDEVDQDRERLSRLGMGVPSSRANGRAWARAIVNREDPQASPSREKSSFTSKVEQATLEEEPDHQSPEAPVQASPANRAAVEPPIATHPAEPVKDEAGQRSQSKRKISAPAG